MSKIRKDNFVVTDKPLEISREMSQVTGRSGHVSQQMRPCQSADKAMSAQLE